MEKTRVSHDFVFGKEFIDKTLKSKRKYKNWTSLTLTAYALPRTTPSKKWKPTEYHSTCTGMARTKMSDNECWWGCGKISSLACCWWEYKGIAALENIWQFLQQVELPCNAPITLLHLYLGRLKMRLHKNLCVYNSIFHNSRKWWKQPQCPSADEWKIKLCSVCVMENDLALQGDEALILQLAEWSTVSPKVHILLHLI